jgi:hypothetical protein
VQHEIALEYLRSHCERADEEKARADRAEAWCERLQHALLGVQDALSGVFPTPQLDRVLAEYEAASNPP